MILSVSRTTDIPCAYPDWFLNRVREGFALVRNPLNPRQLSRVVITPETVDCIVFWSKDPQQLMKHLDELDARGYCYYFQFTLTPYGTGIEPGLREKSTIIDTFRALSGRIGPRRVIWRYDPVLFSKNIHEDEHRRAFERLCALLEGCTDTVTISFVDMYKKLKNAPFYAPSEEEMLSLAAFFADRVAEPLAV